MFSQGRAGPRRRLRWQGLAGPVGHPARPRIHRRRPLSGAGHRGLQRGSGGYARRFAESRGARLVEIDLPTDFGFDIPVGAKAARRAPCSACGLSKRHLFNAAAIDGGYDAVATGHNLDDEAAVLFGNVLRWDLAYLGRQRPVLPAGDGFARKVKPLVRLGERETAAYCVIRGIDYVVEECPMAVGNKHIGYKEALNSIEVALAGNQGCLLLRVPRPGRRPGVGGRPRRSGRASIPARDADHRPSPRYARSASWWTGQRHPPAPTAAA